MNLVGEKAKLKDPFNLFSDNYSVRFLIEISQFDEAPIYELNFIKEGDIMICKWLNPEDDYKRMMFFAGVVD